MTDPQTTATNAAPAPGRGAAPGAGTIAVLALAWLLAMLSSARLALGDSPDADPLTVTRAALELPQVISASLIAGIGVGLATGNLLIRVRPSWAAHPLPRWGSGAAVGALTGLAVAVPIMLGYGELPSIIVLSGTVAAAAALGGLLSGVRHREVVAAGATGALGVFVTGLAARVFEPELRELFGAQDNSAESLVAASGWVLLTASLVGGAVAGLLGYLYLRRSGATGLRWPAYLLAGALPGLLVLLAEAVTRLGGARLFELVSAGSANDQALLSYFNAARFNRALIVVFVGALVATFLLGRTLRPAADADTPPPVAQTAAGAAAPDTPADPDPGPDPERRTLPGQPDPGGPVGDPAQAGNQASSDTSYHSSS